MHDSTSATGWAQFLESDSWGQVRCCTESECMCVTLHYSNRADYSGEPYLTSWSTPGYTLSDLTTHVILGFMYGNFYTFIWNGCLQYYYFSFYMHDMQGHVSLDDTVLIFYWLEINIWDIWKSSYSSLQNTDTVQCRVAPAIDKILLKLRH